MSKCQPAVLVTVAAIVFAGCSESQVPPTGSPASRENGAHQALRVKADLARGRRWELGWGAASAYDVASGQLIRRVPLPGASFAGTPQTCLPDMLLSRSGALIVSSDAQTTVWRVSPSHFEIERYDIAVDSDKDKDFGFSGLAWGADERVLYAVSAAMGTLWRIDLMSSTASKVELSSPIHGACGLAVAASDATGREPPTLVVANGSRNSLQRIFLSSDLTRGVVGNLRATELAAALGGADPSQLRRY